MIHIYSISDPDDEMDENSADDEKIDKELQELSKTPSHPTPHFIKTSGKKLIRKRDQCQYKPLIASEITTQKMSVASNSIKLRRIAFDKKIANATSETMNLVPKEIIFNQHMHYKLSSSTRDKLLNEYLLNDQEIYSLLKKLNKKGKQFSDSDFMRYALKEYDEQISKRKEIAEKENVNFNSNTNDIDISTPSVRKTLQFSNLSPFTTPQLSTPIDPINYEQHQHQNQHQLRQLNNLTTIPFTLSPISPQSIETKPSYPLIPSLPSELKRIKYDESGKMKSKDNPIKSYTEDIEEIKKLTVDQIQQLTGGTKKKETKCWGHLQSFMMLHKLETEGNDHFLNETNLIPVSKVEVMFLFSLTLFLYSFSILILNLIMFVEYIDKIKRNETLNI